MTRAQTQQTLRKLPVKWALALLAIIVLYAVFQPALNTRFGWSLPSLARLMGEPEPKKTVAKDSSEGSTRKSTESKTSQKSDESTVATLADEAGDAQENTTATKDSPSRVATQEPPTSPAQTKTANTSSKAAPPKATNATPPQTQSKFSVETKAEPKAKTGSGDSTLRYGILKETGRDRYVSIEGLQYNPGSEEGHRLKHLERHLQDMPTRPGKHGVFDGEMKDALKWIDDAYARGKSGAKGVRKTEEDNRTVYEVPFTEPIGYIGGRDGNRNGKPKAKRLRLVVEGNKFITAFPF